MDDLVEHHRREAPATYRRRRLGVAMAGVVVVGMLVLGAARWGGDDDAATSAPSGTTVADGSAPSGTTGADGSDPSTTTTALVIPGFSNPTAYLACVKEAESRGDYTVVSPDGRYFGAYQIDQVTWNNTAEHAGLTDLYDIQPNLVAPAGQDQLAMALLEWQGTSPWAGDC